LGGHVKIEVVELRLPLPPPGRKNFNEISSCSIYAWSGFEVSIHPYRRLRLGLEKSLEAMISSCKPAFSS